MQNIKYYNVKKLNSIQEILTNAVEQAGDKVAFMYRKDKNIVSITYKQFVDDVNSLGTRLCNLGLDGKHIAVIGENSYNWITVYLTVLKSNGVFVPVDKELTVQEVINVLKDSDTEVLFYSGKYKKYVDEITKELPNIKYFVGFNEEQTYQHIYSYAEFMEMGRKLFESGDKTFSDITHKDKKKLKMLVYTSGTTDKPKGVMLSEHNLVSCSYYGLQVSNVYTRCLSVLPYHHTYEAVAGILVGIYKNTTICINDNLKNVLKNLQLYKPDYIFLVPAFAEIFYKSIWNNAKKTNKVMVLKVLIILSNFLRKLGVDKRRILFKSLHIAFGGNLRKIVVGGAPLRAELGKFFEDIGIDLINGYGITECSPLVSANMDNFNDPSTVGIVLPCCKIRFENVNLDGNGEICVKGDTVMLGYYKDKKRTDRVLKNGWFNTEDFGKFNDKGQLLINGRKKNVIVLDNGKNIYPEEIESYIQAIPYIAEVIVKAVKNDVGQEVALCAECFLNAEKVKELNVQDVEESLKKDIAKATKDLPIYKHISVVELRDTEFLKTTTNKIKR